MKFTAGNRRKAIEYEKDLVVQWKKNKTFERSVEQRPADNSYVFYDGPPFITGVPHHGTLLSSVVKDAVPRYWTMQGKRVERVWGWDTHGLPAENFVEKQLGITDRHDIGTKISLEKYITTACESMIQTGNLWESTIDRIGRWVDFKGAYKTMDKDYMESVWWAFKQLYEKGKIYEGEKVLMYDTMWATPLSKAEVTMDAGAYQVVTDPSVYVKFKLNDSKKADPDPKQGEIGEWHEGAAHELFGENYDDKTYLLAWTTTPWTLPGNTATAVNPNIEYVLVKVGNNEKFIVAKDRAAAVFTDEKHKPLDYQILQNVTGKELVGLSYSPLQVGIGYGFAGISLTKTHTVLSADYVTAEDGTGVVHLAPAYGEEDFELAKKEGVPVLHVLDEYGNYTDGTWKGLNVWETNKSIAKELKDQGQVWKIDYIQHEYPHNLRNGNRLMYRAHPSWFIDIDGQRAEMLEQNENVNWFPEHIKHGRFQKTIESAPDWNLSRDRFWATAMPVWKGIDGDGKEHIKVVGSYAELKELSGIELSDYHRPWVDDIEFDLDGVHYTRIDKVLDCWFESGSMPFAQFHYPFENKEKFETSFPGQFIVEYVGQVRAWFYYVHAVNVGLFGKNAYQNVIATGTLLGEDGKKLSKSLGNFTDPNLLMDQFSADALRYLLLASPVLRGEDFIVKDREVQDVQRKLAMVWNMYDFFTTYAAVDGWEWHGSLDDPSANLENPLDIWVLSRLHQLQNHLEERMNAYDLPGALEPVLALLDDASNWYVRRSRRRFWKSESDTDKAQAYTTLHYLLTRLSIILAPFVPFLADELFSKLTGGEAGESVHLLNWPQPGAINEEVIDKMAFAREVINQGLSDRAAAKLKVRQPLSKATVLVTAELESPSTEMREIIGEELNVKQVEVRVRGNVDTDKSFAENWQGRDKVSMTKLVELDTEITPELKREGVMRELVRLVQTVRKAAGLQVDDRIVLSIGSDDEEVKQTLAEHADVIKSETLATSLNDAGVTGHETKAAVGGFAVTVVLAKAE